MRRLLLIIFWIAGIGSLCYANSIDIPLMESRVEFSYGDGPKGSTPDPSGGVPYGLSFVILETSLGTTTSKFYRFP